MHFDVAVIGYGPVGALTALSLSHAGLQVLILERLTEASDLPRAVGLDGESLRAFARLGFGDEISSLCQPPRDTNEVQFTNSERVKIFGQDVSQLGPNGWRDIAFFDQPELELELRRIIEKDERIEVRLGTRVVAIDQDDDTVTLSTTDAQATDTDSAQMQYQATYAIGCDGASSFVRDAIGVAWQSLGYDQDWLVLDVIQGPNANLPISTMQVCDPARLTSYIAVKDPNRRWEFQLLEGETREEMLAQEKIDELLEPWIAREDYTIRRKAVYQFHAATADAWRKDRVFLAGDAAHQTPPFLGQGLNAGFRDAVNLGWKIPLVLAGDCDARLLDTYAEERDGHARLLVKRAVSVGKLMETFAAREAGLPDPHPPESNSLDINGPIVPPMDSGILSLGQTAAEHHVGCLLRQPTVRNTDGSEAQLDKFLGQGISLVGRDASDLAMSPEAKALFDRLGGHAVALADFELVEGSWDSLLDAHPAALIRPDRYVFGVVDDKRSLDRLVFELGTMLHVRN